MSFMDRMQSWAMKEHVKQHGGTYTHEIKYTCPRCGSVVGKDDDKCETCGTELEELEE